MMHWRDNWHFSRRTNGDVTIERVGTAICFTIPAQEWVSLIHYLSGDMSAEHYGAAYQFHHVPVGDAAPRAPQEPHQENSK